MALSKKIECGKQLSRKKASIASSDEPSRSTSGKPSPSGKGQGEGAFLNAVTMPPNYSAEIANNAAIPRGSRIPSRAIRLGDIVSQAQSPSRLCTFRCLDKTNERRRDSSAVRHRNHSAATARIRETDQRFVDAGHD